jgi:hypothetical protein
MNKNIGFILIKLQNNPVQDKILQTIKKIEEKNIYGQTIIFNSYTDKADTLNLPILHLSQAQFFFGDLFLFDLASVILTQKFPNINKRILYTNSIPWTANHNNLYAEWESIYLQNNLDLLVDSQSTYDIYDICWKKPIGIAEEFNYEKVIQYI